MRKTFRKGMNFFEADTGGLFTCLADLGEKGLAVQNEAGEVLIVSKSAVTLEKVYQLHFESPITVTTKNAKENNK